MTDTHLIVHKVARPEFLPSQELTYKRVDVPCLQTGEVAITLAGFKVSLYRAEHVVDENGEQTSRLMMVPVQDKKQATYMEFHLGKREDFRAAAKKLDVFPADLLEGEWFYSEVFVETNRRTSLFLEEGRTNNPRHFGFETISRVKFSKFKNVLKAFDANVVESEDDEGSDENNEEKDDKSNSFTAIEIPVEWVDYRIKTINGTPQLEEEELGNDHPEAKENFHERAYGKFDFIKMSRHRELESIYKSTTLQELQVDENYISFVLMTDLEDYGFISIRYSFKRAHSPKKARHTKIQDKSLFGVFQTHKDYIKGSPQHHRPEDLEKILLLNRFIFNPDEKREIIFHFTPGSPEKWRFVGDKSIAAWDAAFQKANTGIRIKLANSELPLGDLRGNIINIVDHDRESNSVAGYGPSVVDSKSGEIISATANIYVPALRDLFQQAVRKYLIYKLKGYDTSSFNKVASSTLVTHSSQDDMAIKYSLDIYQEFKGLEKELKKESDPILRSSMQFRIDLINGILAIDENKNTLEEKLEERQIQLDFIKKGKHSQTFENYPLLFSDFIQRIEENCNNYLDNKKEFEIDHFLSEMEGKVNYTAEIGKRVFIPTDEEMPVLKECAEALLPDALVAVAIHEMGHNFAMKHNFAASSDVANFNSKGDEDTKVISSSVMDYVPFYNQNLLNV